MIFYLPDRSCKTERALIVPHSICLRIKTSMSRSSYHDFDFAAISIDVRLNEEWPYCEITLHGNEVIIIGNPKPLTCPSSFGIWHGQTTQ